MKKNQYLATENLLGLGERLLEKTGREKLQDPCFVSMYPVEFDSWYCRTQITACPYGREVELAERLASGIRGGELPWLVSVIEEESSNNLIEALERAGFALRKPQTGVVLKLEDYEPLRPDAHVVRIGRDRLEEWCSVAAEAFRKKSELRVMELLVDEPDCDFYGYEVDGKLVSTLLLFRKDGVAGMHEVGTLRDHRRHGFCRALVNQALVDAREKGCTVASAQSSVRGKPVYQRIGMRTVCHLRVYDLL